MGKHWRKGVSLLIGIFAINGIVGSAHSQSVGNPPVCWVGPEHRTLCKSRAEFAHALDVKPTDESTSVDELARFQQDALLFKYPKTDFEKMVIKALEAIGSHVDPKFGPRNAYIQTEWNYSVGRKAFFKTWKQRLAYSILMYKDLYTQNLYGVYIGCSIEESPDGREWAAVERQDDIDRATTRAAAALRSAVASGGGE